MWRGTAYGEKDIELKADKNWLNKFPISYSVFSVIFVFNYLKVWVYTLSLRVVKRRNSTKLTPSCPRAPLGNQSIKLVFRACQKFIRLWHCDILRNQLLKMLTKWRHSNKAFSKKFNFVYLNTNSENKPLKPRSINQQQNTESQCKFEIAFLK